MRKNLKMRGRNFDFWLKYLWVVDMTRHLKDLILGVFHRFLIFYRLNNQTVDQKNKGRINRE